MPHRTSDALEDEICSLRKELTDLGVDAGAQTIAYHLSLHHTRVPSIATIWRVFRRRGFVVPQPHKRPRSSWHRLEAKLPNGCWRSDVDPLALGRWHRGRDREFHRQSLTPRDRRLGDGHRERPRGPRGLPRSGRSLGFPEALLTDNGCVYTTWHRGGRNVMQAELLAMGIDYRHSRPYHPQTCGKVERFHQTMKAYLARQPTARSIRALQRQADRFIAYYNDVRPHAACGRRPPRVAFEARDKACASGPRIVVGAGVRVRRHRIDNHGRVTLRHRTRLHHIGVGARHRGKRVILSIHDLDVRIVTLDGELLRHFNLDPTRDYQPQGS